MWNTSGYNYFFFDKNSLLRSFPAALVLVLPRTTPSGFIIGAIKKLTLFLNYSASFVYPKR